MSYDEIIEYSKTATIDELKKVLSNKLKKADYGSIVCQNQTFNGFYRARKHKYFNGDFYEGNNEIFISEKEFWNPPIDRIKYNGRCNRKGESIFYASTKFETAIKEVKPEVGKYITVCSFKPKTKNNSLPTFRIKPVVIKQLKKIDRVYSCIENFEPDSQSEDFTVLEDFLDKLFTQQVNDKQYYLYKITNAITECMLTNMINDKGQEFTMNGMLYPSISDEFNGLNLILKPDSCKYFVINSIQTFRVEKNKKFDDSKYCLTHIRDGYLAYDEYELRNQCMEWKDHLTGDTTLI